MKEQDIVFVGQGATIQIGSDRYAYTIIDVSPSKKTLTLQRDAKIGPLYMSDVNGDKVQVRASRKYGKYMMKTRYFVTIGIRDGYIDPCF